MHQFIYVFLCVKLGILYFYFILKTGKEKIRSIWEKLQCPLFFYIEQIAYTKKLGNKVFFNI